MQNLVGRTARSGLYTEGSAIVTDINFYDNRLKRKKGGMYRWSECKKMFDYGNSEACESSILLLVSDLQIDYDFSYKSEALTSYIIKNYNKLSCFQTLIIIIQESYRKHVTDVSRYNYYSSIIEQKITQIEHVVESIENYLCYVYSSHKENEQFFELVEDLVTQTFAHYLGNDDQKDALITIFLLIAQKIISDIKPEKLSYYAKSLYGIDISNQVLSWVNENIDELEDSSNTQLLDSIANLFRQLFPDLSKIEAEVLVAVARLWISGEPYVGIYNKLNGIISINEVEKVCSKTLSYHLCFLIGNIVDAIGEKAEELSGKLSLVQKMVKYGVSTRFEILICENLFDDRIIAKKLDNVLGQTLVNENELKKFLSTNKKKVWEILQQYPDYFSYKFHLFIRRV